MRIGSEFVFCIFLSKTNILIHLQFTIPKQIENFELTNCIKPEISPEQRDIILVKKKKKTKKQW